MIKLSRVRATPQQLKDWDDTRAVLMWYAPAFTHLFYTLMNKDDKYVAVFTTSKLVPTAATDGTSVIINVDTFFKHPLMERLFIVGHEILHNILNHIPLLAHCRRTGRVVLADGRSLPYVDLAMQVALDYVVNAILVDAKLGTKPDNALWDIKIATHLESVLDVYAKLVRVVGGGGGGGDEDDDGGSGGKGDDDGGGGDQPGRAPGGFDSHLDPGTVDGKDPVQAEAERNQAEWDVAIKAAMELAQSQGKLPAGIKRLFEEVIEDKVDWSDIAQSWFARKVGSGSSDWRHPDRKLIVRDIWAPGRTGHGAELVVIACDTSSSITPRILDRWFSVLGSILEQVRPRRIIVIWCDAEVGRVDEVEEASDLESIRRAGAPGGGGTDFRPVFKYVYDQRLEPDALVFLTDGYGYFPEHAPNYPLFWGSIGRAPEEYPFGEVVVIPED